MNRYRQGCDEKKYALHDGSESRQNAVKDLSETARLNGSPSFEGKNSPFQAVE